MSGPARLSAILATDTWESAAATVRHLSRQSRAGEVEVVLVAPPGAVRVAAEAGRGLAAIRLVEEADALADLANARAVGVRAATAPIVVLAETHSFPRPGWADALLKAFEDDDVVAAGPSVVNANPDTLRSWVAVLMDYGPWLDPADASESCSLPGHNSAFRRDALVARGDALRDALRSDMLLGDELRRAGRRVRLEPEARTAHVNVTRPVSWARERVGAGRVFASARAASWPLGRRAAFAAAAPLIPFVRLPRTLADARRTRLSGAPGARAIPLLVAGLGLSAVGEALGYATGAGRAMAVAEEMELHRLHHVRPAERGRW